MRYRFVSYDDDGRVAARCDLRVFSKIVWWYAHVRESAGTLQR